MSWCFSISRIVFLLAVISVVGCQPANPLGRKAISGEVTVDGTALANGSISFDPVEQGGVTSGGVITNGEFMIKTERGLPPGKYVVRINASEDDGAAAVAPPGAPGEVAKELIPAKWNRDSQETIEVTEDGYNDFTFQIES